MRMKSFILVVATAALLPSMVRGQSCPVLTPNCAPNQITCTIPSTAAGEDGCYELNCLPKEDWRDLSDGSGARVKCVPECEPDCKEEYNQVECILPNEFPDVSSKK